MRRLTQGSIEFLVVDVEDQLENVNTLDGTSPTYTIIEEAGGAIKVNNQPANNDGMSVYGLADTTQPTLWEPGLYKMYVGFTIGPETPRLGPFKFRVDV